MNKIVKEKVKRLGHDIYIELIKFSKDKKKIALLGITDNHTNDFFPALCNLHSMMHIGEKFIDDANNFHTEKTKLEDIYNKFDMIIVIDGVDYAEDYNITFETVDKKIVKLTYFTRDTFTSANINLLLPNYGEDILDMKIIHTGKDMKLNCTIKDKYRYLIE